MSMYLYVYVYVYIHISSTWGCLDPYKDKIAKLQNTSSWGIRTQLQALGFSCFTLKRALERLHPKPHTLENYTPFGHVSRNPSDSSGDGPWTNQA